MKNLYLKGKEILSPEQGYVGNEAMLNVYFNLAKKHCKEAISPIVVVKNNPYLE